MQSIATIGNATLIAYDNNLPILSTDPWFGDEDDAYFGSWTLSHEIPANYKKDILDSEYIWFSHGHPDHLNPFSLRRLEGKNLLLPDHVGSRIYDDLCGKDFNIKVLPDRKWLDLTKNIRVMCITTILQDSILLISVGKRLFINLNDAGTRGCTRFIKKEAKKFLNVYLLSLSGYGDADMINCYDKKGNFIIPPAKNNTLVGEQLSLTAKSVNASHVIPFSSHHQYQRSDSIWAQEYVTPIHAYSMGLHEDINFIPPFVEINCESGDFKEIHPKAIKPNIFEPEQFDDNWSDELTAEDFLAIKNYFIEKEVICNRFGFINFIVGKKHYSITLNKSLVNRGIQFEVPRSSLLKAINYEIFDDLLIGNFMRTTFFGLHSLYDFDFNPLLTKYADNGKAKTEEEVHRYINEYKKRVGRQFIFDTFLDKSASILNRFLTNRESRARRLIKSIYYKIK
ncbi:MAG: MBL fold metallo-hydrolase [Gammaproteobacteria bacterium]|nr:MBL fold metallo-hydrolase [Gammaproteobacteria bacterium]